MKVLFLVLVYVFNFDLFEFSDASLEEGLLQSMPGLTLRIDRILKPGFPFSILIAHKNIHVTRTATLPGASTGHHV